jgi:hypothetical protein
MFRTGMSLFGGVVLRIGMMEYLRGKKSQLGGLIGTQVHM